MKRLSLILGLLTPVLFFPGLAFAQVSFAAAPDATFLMGADMFSGGQSNNLGPALNQVLDNHWIDGPCTSADDYAKCDSIRFGMTVYAPGDCSDAISPQVVAAEDGGDLVEARAQSIHNEGGTTWCDDSAFRPHDTGLEQHQKMVLPSGASASDAELDQYWERPRLTLMFVGSLPTAGSNRTIDSLRAACDGYQGAGGILPSMPTWTFVTRKYNTDAVPYAGLVAAAGGTGSCCYRDGTSTCNYIDVCTHIEDGRSDAQIRTDIADGEYDCGANGTTFGVGALDFGTKTKGTLPEIRCHLVGTSNNDNCSSNNRSDTDLLGVFACVRQLPRGVTAADASFLYCPTTDPADCIPLADAGGSIEWIDENKTLYLIKGVACDAVAVGTCDENVPCPAPGATGRCAWGRTDCSTGTEVCVSAFTPMPEICNGLDDDCDGKIDNMIESWRDPAFGNYSLPDDHEGLHCNLRDVCVCPDGATDLHAGANFSAYLDAWDPICQCGEGLAMSEAPAPTPTPTSTDESADPAACSAATSRSAGLPGVLVAMLLGFVALRRRR